MYKVWSVNAVAGRLLSHAVLARSVYYFLFSKSQLGLFNRRSFSPQLFGVKFYFIPVTLNLADAVLCYSFMLLQVRLLLVFVAAGL